MDELEHRFSPHDLLRLVFRRRYLFLVGTAIFALAVMLGSHYVPLKYTGKAVFESGLETAASEYSPASKVDFANTQDRLQHDLAGPQAVEAAATEIGLLEGLPRDKEGELTAEGKAQKQLLIDQLTKSIEISWEAKSNQQDLVAVKFTHEDPKVAQQMPNSLVAGYINRTYERIRNGLKEQHEFLQHKVGDCDKVMEELQAKKTKFELDHPGMLPENPTALQERIQRTRSEIDAHRQQQAVADSTIARLKAMQQGATSKPDSALQMVKMPNPELAVLRAQLQKAKDERADKLSLGQMTPNHPTILALDARIEQLTKQLAETPTEVVKETIYGQGQTPVDVSVALAAATSQSEADGREITRLEALLTNYETLWNNFGPVRQDWLRFQKEYDEHNAETKGWRGRLENLEVALSASMNNRLTHLKAIQPAHEQIYPSSPALPMILAIAIAGGFAFGAILVFLSKVLDRSIGTSEDIIKYFNLPVHGVICEIVTARQKMMRNVRRYTMGPSIAIVLIIMLAAASTSVVLRLQNPTKYDQLRTSPLAFVQQEIITPAKNIFSNM